MTEKKDSITIFVPNDADIKSIRQEFEASELSKEYKLGDIPKGASQLVDIFGQLFVKTYGFEKLEQIAKMNFKNVEKIKNPLEKLF